MQPQFLKDLLKSIQSGQTSVEAAMEKLKTLSFEPLAGLANLDHHRELRTGVPEVILGQGKTPQQVAEIFQRLASSNGRALATRVQPDVYARIRDRLPQGTQYHELARVLYLEREANPPRRPGIVVLSAGTSDMPVAEEAAISAEWMGNRVERVYDVGVAGLHRLLHHLPILQQARVIIAVAGMEGALPSVVGGLVSCPVIGVPTSVGYGTSYGGLAALLAMLNSCASGVAVMNIDNGFGAACLANRINRLAEERHEPSSD